MRAAPRLAPALTAMLLAGCGISDPYTHPTSQPPAGSTATATNVGPGPSEHDGPAAFPPAPRPATAYAATARAALARYARLYLNWSWRTVQGVERQLASLSAGQARAQALAGARQPPGQLARYQVRNAGQLAALSAGQGPARGQWAVVANEHTAGSGPYQGLPAVSEVIWATVTHAPRGWIVTGWYPAAATP